MFFENRQDAGQQLAERLPISAVNAQSWHVIGIARGGVIVAHAMAHHLNTSLSALCVKHIKTSNREVFLTGLGSGCRMSKTSSSWLPHVTSNDTSALPAGYQIEHILAKQSWYNDGEAFPLGANVILCDDGFVSGKTMLVAAKALKEVGITKIVLAVPVIPGWFKQADYYGFDVVFVKISMREQPATGSFYFNFEDTPDEEVVAAVQSRRQFAFA